MIAIQRTKQLDTSHYILIPFRPFFPSIRIFLLLNDHLSRLPRASSDKSGNVVSNLLMLFIMFFNAGNRDANVDYGARFYSCGVHAGIAKIYIIVLPMLPFR